MLDGKQRQNIKGDQKDNCEFNAGAKRIGQRFLINPYLPKKKGAESPESKNSAPANGSYYFFHPLLLAKRVACRHFISSALAPRFNKVKAVFGWNRKVI